MATTKLNSYTPATYRLCLIIQSNKELSNILECPNITNNYMHIIENKARNILQTQSDTIKYDMINESIPYINCNAYSIIEYAATPLHLFLDENANENKKLNIDKYF